MEAIERCASGEEDVAYEPRSISGSGTTRIVVERARTTSGKCGVECVP